MTKRLLSLIVLAVLAGALVAACGGPSSSPAVSDEAQKYVDLKGDPAKGAAAYQTTCSACHGPDAKGVAGLGKDLTTSEFAKALPDAEFVLFLTAGRPASDPLNTTGVDMPPRGGNPALKDQDLADIVAYVRSVQK
jgi:disulfide bond formation protein DsbB